MRSLEKTVRSVREEETLKEGLRVYNLFVVLASLYAFVYIMLSLLQKDILLALKMACVLFVPFALVTVLRYAVRAPRPYDLFGIGHPFGKEKCSSHGAFPSRHVFSAALLGTALLAVSPLFGGILLALAVLLAVDRVLLGFHFPRDVVAGYLIGIFAGAIGLSVIHFL